MEWTRRHRWGASQPLLPFLGLAHGHTQQPHSHLPSCLWLTRPAVGPAETPSWEFWTGHCEMSSFPQASEQSTSKPGSEGNRGGSHARISSDRWSAEKPTEGTMWERTWVREAKLTASFLVQSSVGPSSAWCPWIPLTIENLPWRPFCLN